MAGFASCRRVAVLVSAALAVVCARAVERTAEASNVLENLRRLPGEGRYLVSWTHPWNETGGDFAVKDASGAWRAKDLKDIRLDGYVTRATGKDPLLYFTDFYHCLGTWESPARYARAAANMEGFIRKAYETWHSVPVFSWHIENPYATAAGVKDKMAKGCAYRYRFACENYPQEHRHVFREILSGTGGVCGGGRANAEEEASAPTFPTPRAWYDAQLDKICAFLKRLVDSDGRPIPAVVRLFHECEDDWMWWGPKSATAEEYKAVFRYTVGEIRRRTGLASLLFLYSPDRYWGKKESFLRRYPGDDVVDIIGFDDYSIGCLPKDWTGDRAEGVKTSLEKTIARMRIVSEIARERGKPAGIIETGVNGDFDLTGEASAGEDGFYGLLRTAMTAPGVSFSFFNTWGGSYTVPKSEAGKAKWREFLSLPEALTAERGYDLTAKNPTAGNRR